jgi:hypothetical protein
MMASLFLVATTILTLVIKDSPGVKWSVASDSGSYEIWEKTRYLSGIPSILQGQIVKFLPSKPERL